MLGIGMIVGPMPTTKDCDNCNRFDGRNDCDDIESAVRDCWGPRGLVRITEERDERG